MNRMMKLSVFALVAAAQLAAPAWMIHQHEQTLRYGTVYKFRTVPVDPYDPFRGRYVMLGFDQNTAPWTGPGVFPANGFEGRKRFYASIAVGEDGFAKFSGVGPNRPASGDHLRVSAWVWIDYSDPSKTAIRLELPFDRYYMNERLAPEAESEYWSRNREEAKNSYVTVRVLNGRAVLEGLYLDGQPIEDVIRKKIAAP